MGSLSSWVQPDAYTAAALPHIPRPPYPSQSYRESSGQKDFQVTRTGARALLIGSEDSSEQWPRRKLGAQRNACHPCGFWQRPLFCRAHGSVEASHAPPPLPPWPPPSLIPGPEREAALLAAGPGAVATSQGGAVGRRLLQWLLVLKPRGQSGGLCPWPETQRGLRGIHHHLQLRYGRVASLVMPMALDWLGPSGAQVSRAGGLLR